MSRIADALQPEIVIRGGFGAEGARLRERPRRIAYLGASVTAQGEGYRPKLHERLCRSFGQEHESLLAGVGAIGIASAVFLVDDLVVDRRPDLCLIEYTTAELVGKRSVGDAEAAMDGVVTKLIAADCAPCMLHLPRRRWPPRGHEVRRAFERVADRHGIPTIDLTSAFADAGHLKGGESIFRDEVHPTARGSEEIAALAGRAMTTIADASRPAGGPPPAAHAEGRFHRARLAKAGPGDAGGAGRAGRFRLTLPFLEVGPGEPIRVQPEGELHGLALLIGPESGEIEVDDGHGAQRVMAWDDTCFYERYGTVLFERPCPPGAAVEISLTGRSPDYASCRRPVDPPAQRSLRVVGYLELPA